MISKSWISGGWFFPTWNARKCHFDDGTDVSLCRKWRRVNSFTGAEMPLQGDADAAPSLDDYKACRRKLEELKARAAES